MLECDETAKHLQYQTSETLREAFNSKLKSDFKTIIDYDAAADLYVENYESYINAFSDPYYLNVIEPDEQKFVDKGQLGQAPGKKTVVRALTTVGINRSIIKDGKPAMQVDDEIWAKFNASREK